MIRKMTVA